MTEWKDLFFMEELAYTYSMFYDTQIAYCSILIRIKYFVWGKNKAIETMLINTYKI